MEELIRLSAPVKLNLFLHVTGRRDDGNHELQTLFRLLDYGDELDCILRSDGQVRVHCEGAEVEEAFNLVGLTARLLKEAGKVSAGADIRLRKSTPPGAGLGGGSSDAATVMWGLNVLWECGFGSEHLAKLGVLLGADIPVFLYGHSAWAEGVGEELTPVELPDAWYLVLLPDSRVSTAEMFAAEELARSAEPITLRDYHAGRAKNVFEPLVRKRFPPVAQALDWLNDYCDSHEGCSGGAKLSGTGCSVFAEFAERREALAALAASPAGAGSGNGSTTGFGGFVARGLNTSPLFTQLGRKGAPPSETFGPFGEKSGA